MTTSTTARGSPRRTRRRPSTPAIAGPSLPTGSGCSTANRQGHHTNPVPGIAARTPKKPVVDWAVADEAAAAASGLADVRSVDCHPHRLGGGVRFGGLGHLFSESKCGLGLCLGRVDAWWWARTYLLWVEESSDVVGSGWVDVSVDVGSSRPKDRRALVRTSWGGVSCLEIFSKQRLTVLMTGWFWKCARCRFVDGLRASWQAGVEALRVGFICYLAAIPGVSQTRQGTQANWYQNLPLWRFTLCAESTGYRHGVSWYPDKIGPLVLCCEKTGPRFCLIKR